MDRAAAASARLAVDIEPDVLARQMIGQRFAPGLRLARRFFHACLDRRMAFANARDIAVEVLESECHLVWIEALGAASELRPLELLDDELKALDLAVAALDDGRHVAHQMVQERRIDGQIVEIDSHARFYFERSSKLSIFSMFCLMFRTFSTSDRRSPDALGNPPVDALDQHGELRRTERDGAFEPRHPRPHESALIEPLGEQAQPVSVPKKDLDDLGPLAPEGEQMAAKRILLQRALNQQRQPVHALPHVGVAQRQMHFHPCRHDHHRASSRSATCRRTASGSAPDGAKTRRPSASSTAVIPSGGCNRSCSMRGVEAAPICPLASFTAASFALLFLPKPSSARHRNTTLATIPRRRATDDTVSPARSVSRT